MEVEKFTFLKLYADTIKKISEWNEQLAKDLSWKIIQYGIYWIDEKTDDPILEALFINIRIMIDRWKEISIQNSENWKKWWRWKNQTKSETKSETKAKQKQKESETKTKKSKIENIKYKIENKTNNISLSKDKETETEVSEYWNQEVNQAIELIKKYNWWILDWTIKNNRRYAKMLIDKLKKLDSIQQWKFTWYETLDILLNLISKNKYHASKITSSESIYRNLAVLMQACKNDIWKQQTVILPTI